MANFKDTQTAETASPASEKRRLQDLVILESDDVISVRLRSMDAQSVEVSLAQKRRAAIDVWSRIVTQRPPQAVRNAGYSAAMMKRCSLIFTNAVGV
ncbi:hypothetical protein NDU88_004818 [Pleurodeles waltl]|uniref:Uncharacterized protein n=1 Tax=Pleurodeles waltl TaxID=8319 RepID=A0AAV7QD26_PLEWA|nr:hypothetical protein NDU88_004818 [Pleurodeles waltl]